MGLELEEAAGGVRPGAAVPVAAELHEADARGGQFGERNAGRHTTAASASFLPRLSPGTPAVRVVPPAAGGTFYTVVLYGLYSRVTLIWIILR